MISLPNNWDAIFPSSWWSTPEGKRLEEFLNKPSSEPRYPSDNLIFNALALASPQNIKVVILGQDPYHGPHQAHGLAFSVPKGVPIPPSLRNIFKELEADLGVARTTSDLSDWARQGVLLLNSSLTVEEGKAGSHMSVWEPFTDTLIASFAACAKHPILFVLWGAFAQKKKNLIRGHEIIQSAHPSPLSAHRGFLGSRPFSKINSKLDVPICWGNEKHASE